MFNYNLFGQSGLPVGRLDSSGDLYRVGDIFPAGRIENDGSIYRRGLPVPVGRIDPNTGTIYNTLNLPQQNFGMTRAEVLLNMVAPPPVYPPPPASAVLPAPYVPRPQVVPSPVEDILKEDFQRLCQFATGELAMSPDEAGTWARGLMRRNLKPGAIHDEDRAAHRFYLSVKAKFDLLFNFATSWDVGMSREAARKWAYARLEKKMNLVGIKMLFQPLYEFARSSSGMNMFMDDAQEWALQFAERMVKSDEDFLELSLDSHVIQVVRDAVERILNAHRKGFERRVNYMAEVYKREYNHARAGKWRGGMGLPGEQAHNYALKAAEHAFQSL